MIVAYRFPHNEGVEVGYLNGPGQTTGLALVDLYEVDGEIRSFDDAETAQAWLDGKTEGYDEDDQPVTFHDAERVEEFDAMIAFHNEGRDE